MELNVQDWKEFKLNKIVTLKGGFYNKKPEHSENGKIPFLASTESNNGVTEYYSIEDIKAWNKVGEPDNTLENKLFSGNCIAVTVNGSVCNAFYQKKQFTCSHDITALYLKKHVMNIYIGQFICTIIMLDKYRWNYGRKPHDVKKFGESIIRFPVQHNPDGTLVFDQNRTYSDEGYIPDWQFMEDYIKSLHHKPITTKVKKNAIKELEVDKWEEFYLKDLFTCQMGNGIDASATSSNNPQYNYVSRDSKGNGVVAQVDEYFNSKKNCTTTKEEPFQAGTMTLALGGSFLGSCFVQKYPYYTAQNVAVLTEKEPLSIATKLFISTLIRNECKYKYLAFGRELNTHYKTDFMIKLPIQRDSKGQPIIDSNHTYSEKGYIPDWQFMEDYINSLPYSDRI